MVTGLNDLFRTRLTHNVDKSLHYLNKISDFFSLYIATVSVFVDMFLLKVCELSHNMVDGTSLLHILMHRHTHILKFSTHIHILNTIVTYIIDGSIFYNGSTIRRRKVGSLEHMGYTNINVYLLFIMLHLILQEQTETRLNDPIDEQSKISL